MEAEAAFQQAQWFHLRARLHEARACYEHVLRLQPHHSAALHFLGIIALQSDQPSLAAELIGRALKIDPTCVPAYVNYGGALHELRRFAEAIEVYDQALAFKPDCAEAFFNRGNSLRELRRYAEAVASYDRAIAVKRDYAEAHLNRGLAWSALDDKEAAIASYENAIAVRAAYPDAHFNRANELRSINRLEAALAGYDRAIALQPGFAAAHLNRGTTLVQMRMFGEAIASYDAALSLEPDSPALVAVRRHTKLQICDWSGLTADVAAITAGVDGTAAPVNPFFLLPLCDSPTLQQRAAVRWVSAQCPSDAAVVPIATRHHAAPIHIGYFSADYHEHATSYLIAQLLELHDRSRFRVSCISFGPPSEGAMRKRLVAGCDDFIDVRGQSDASIALLARSRGIDIAVDLKGFTQDNRIGIFAHRAAPLQVNFLGYPGTMGAPFIDYIIADPVVIPESLQHLYTEKIIRLPHSYQVNDAARAIAAVSVTRSELNLPHTGFVFCCFNNAYKILPAMFDRWMRILSRVDGSVLWLLGDNPGMIHNLQREAAARGIAPERLIFADRIDVPHHLARHRAADLFIDTLPCNAHTTGSDALWAGVPLLTCAGDSFAARVAASLLRAIGLPELIAETPERYEEMAIHYARHPDLLSDIRRRLNQNRLTEPLFDTPRYCRDLEAALAGIYGRQQAGDPPNNLRIHEPES